MTVLRVLDIIAGTTVDGPGLRTSVYLAGCSHHCAGCHNPGSWDFGAGTPMTVDEIMSRIEEEDFDVTISGGDPLYSARNLEPLLRAIRSRGYGVWLYTGFRWEEIPEGARGCLKYVDVVVDGPYVEALRDTSLLFRGSANQRLIDVSASLAEGTVVTVEK